MTSSLYSKALRFLCRAAAAELGWVFMILMIKPGNCSNLLVQQKNVRQQRVLVKDMGHWEHV